MHFLKEIHSCQIVLGAIAINMKIEKIDDTLFFLVSLTASADRSLATIFPPVETFRRFSLSRRESEEYISKKEYVSYASKRN